MFFLFFLERVGDVFSSLSCVFYLFFKFFALSVPLSIETSRLDFLDNGYAYDCQDSDNKQNDNDILNSDNYIWAEDDNLSDPVNKIHYEFSADYCDYKRYNKYYIITYMDYLGSEKYAKR